MRAVLLFVLLALVVGCNEMPSPQIANNVHRVYVQEILEGGRINIGGMSVGKDGRVTCFRIFVDEIQLGKSIEEPMCLEAQGNKVVLRVHSLSDLMGNGASVPMMRRQRED